MFTQSFLRYICNILNDTKIFVWETAPKIKAVIWDDEDVRELFPVVMVILAAIHISNLFMTQWRRSIAAQYYHNGYHNNVVVLGQRVSSLEEHHTKLSKIGNIQKELTLLRNKICQLENLVRVVDQGTTTKYFRFEPPFSSGSNPKNISSRKRIRSSKEVRAQCRSLYGNQWWKHPNKSQRLAHAKKQLSK